MFFHSWLFTWKNKRKKGLPPDSLREKKVEEFEAILKKDGERFFGRRCRRRVNCHPIFRIKNICTMKKVVIVGAGPQSLAILLRLFSNKSIFTDAELTTSKKFWDQKTTPEIMLDDVLVIDPHGWLGCWREKLDKQKLEYLRSPLFFHPGTQKKASLSLTQVKILSTMLLSLSMPTRLVAKTNSNRS